MKPFCSVGVIGAGVIGVATAFELSRRGFDVVVYDPAPPGEAGPSHGNAGHIASSDIHPLSVPGIQWKALKMLLDKNGPLKVSPKYLMTHLPWFWQFLKTSNAKQFKTATRALTYLCQQSLKDTRVMLRSANMFEHLYPAGCAFVYDTKESLINSEVAWKAKRLAGFSSQKMDARQIEVELPEIADYFHGAVKSSQWATVSDPLEIVRGIASAAKSKGVKFDQLKVSKISLGKDSIEIENNAGVNSHDFVVVAAGIGSTFFAHQIGDTMPMISERGYNLTIPNPNIKLNTPIVFADRGIVATQLTRGLRIGGWAEYAKPTRGPNQKYFGTIARIATEMFPNLKLDNAIYWMGNRPSLPDSVPIISRSARTPRVYYNCGHGHYGLTHAATSARILSGILEESIEAEIEKSYSICRFRNYSICSRS